MGVYSLRLDGSKHDHTSAQRTKVIFMLTAIEMQHIPRVHIARGSHGTPVENRCPKLASELESNLVAKLTN